MIKENSPLIPKKRIKLVTSTELESVLDQNNDQCVKHASQCIGTSDNKEQKAKSSKKINLKFGNLFKKISTNWREQRKKLKLKFLRRKTSLARSQATTAGAFTVTNIPEEKFYESVSGFKVIPTYQDFKDELM